MSEHDELIELLTKDAPRNDYHMEDEDFDQKIWYRDNCRKAAASAFKLGMLGS